MGLALVISFLRLLVRLHESVFSVLRVIKIVEQVHGEVAGRNLSASAVQATQLLDYRYIAFFLKVEIVFVVDLYQNLRAC